MDQDPWTWFRQTCMVLKACRYKTYTACLRNSLYTIEFNFWRKDTLKCQWRMKEQHRLFREVNNMLLIDCELHLSGYQSRTILNYLYDRIVAVVYTFIAGLIVLHSPNWTKLFRNVWLIRAINRNAVKWVRSSELIWHVFNNKICVQIWKSKTVQHARDDMCTCCLLECAVSLWSSKPRIVTRDHKNQFENRPSELEPVQPTSKTANQHW